MHIYACFFFLVWGLFQISYHQTKWIFQEETPHWSGWPQHPTCFLCVWGKVGESVTQFEKHGRLGRPKCSEVVCTGTAKYNEGKQKSMPRGGLYLHSCSVPGLPPSHKTPTQEAAIGTLDTCPGERDPTFTQWMRTTFGRFQVPTGCPSNVCSAQNRYIAAP